MAEPRLIPIADWRRGARTNPAFQRGSQLAGLDMVNIAVEGQGRPMPRAGYTVVEDIEVLGNGNQLVRAHDLGTQYREPITKTYRIFSNQDYVIDNGRMLLVGSGSPKWVDMRRDDPDFGSGETAGFDLGLAPPPLAPTVGASTNIELTSREDSNDEVILFNVFNIVYTFESIKFGFETYPSQPTPFIWETVSGGRYSRRDQSVRVGIPNQDLPEWVERINIYMQNIPIFSSDFGGSVPIVDQLIRNPRQYIQGVIANIPLFVQEGDIRYIRPFEPDESYDVRYLKMGAFRLIGSPENFDFGANLLTINDVDFNFFEGDKINAAPDTGGYNQAIPMLVGAEALEENSYLGDQFESETPTGLSKVMLYADRLWGYDPQAQLLRFTPIGQYDVFPKDFALNLAKSGQSHVEKLIPAPSVSAFFVFKQNAIHVVRGKGQISGIRSKSVANTDLDTSGVILGHGTLSPRTVISGENGIYFISRDKKLKYLTIDGYGNTDVDDVGIAIDEYLAELTLEEQKNLVAFLYSNCYHIIMPDYVLALDIQKRYWTRLTWDLLDAFWSEGGVQGESTLYAIRSHDSKGRFTNDIVKLYEGDSDGDSDIPCEWESQDIPLPFETPVTGLIIQHSSPPQEMSFELYMDGELVGEFTDIPERSGHYRIGCFGYGTLARIRLKCADGIPLIHYLALEIP